MFKILSLEHLDSPIFERITLGRSVESEEITRPAETNCHLVISKGTSHSDAFFVGPWSAATKLKTIPGAEIIWIRLRLGAHFRKVPTIRFRDAEVRINRPGRPEIFLGDDTFEMPSPENVDVFLEHLEKARLFGFDPLVEETQRGDYPPMPDRSLRYRILTVAGLSNRRLFQIQRSHRARELLLSGASISEVVYSQGYYDQSHLTRNLRAFFGVTPGSIPRR
jgi:hypothetical protein